MIFTRHFMKKVLSVVFHTLVSLTLFAQNNPYNEVSIASPNASSLGKYGDIPINYHTGIPQISIPLYTIKEGPLTLPISVSYHASGLKVLETSSWVGTGWALNAGGVITRTVQGAPDEKQTSSIYDQTHGYLSDSGVNKYLWIPASFSSDPYPPTAPQANFSFRQDWSKFSEGRKDGEPDLFFFNVSGYSGKFYFNDDGKAVVVPEQDIKIDYTYTPSWNTSIESFILTVPDGTKYHFGKTSSTTDIDPVEKTNPVSPDAGFLTGNTISSWFLNKIVSHDGMFSTTLKYLQENYSYYTISMFPIDAVAVGQTEYKLIKNIVNGVRLDSILFPNGKIKFTANSVRQDLGGTIVSFLDDANTQSKALDGITITDNTSLNCKKFNFSYSYFEDNSTALPGYFSSYGLTADKKRLKLNSIQEQSCDGTVIIPAHQFEYYTDFVPRRLSFGIDHWGFYNGVTTNSTLIPTYTVDEFTEVYGANRDANWPAMRAGSLKKITYPTGGNSAFDFESHKTWVSYTKKQLVFRFQQSAGYDGSSNWVINTQTFSGNTYKFSWTNSAAGSQALLNIYRVSDNNLMNGWVIEPGQSFITNLTYAAGSYRLELKKLTAQTGQGTIASFEEWAPSLIQNNETVGGLRIKTVTHHDGVSIANDNIQTYSYDINSTSTGILYSRPSYVFKIRNDILRDIGYSSNTQCNPLGCVDCNGAAFLKSPNSIRPMETTQGNHIGYSEVKVSQAGNGYSIYQYYGSTQWDNNKDDVAYRRIITTNGCEPTITNYPFAPFPHEFLRGELKYVANYTELAQKIKETEYYPVYTINTQSTPAFIATFLLGSTGLLGTFYQITNARKTQVQVIDRVITPGIGTVQTSSFTYYESAFHNQPTRTTSTSSTGETIETKIKYVNDFNINECDTYTVCQTNYNAAAASALSLYNSTDSSCPSHTCKWWAWQYYIKALSDARNTFVNCRRTNYTGTTNNYTSCLTTKKGTADSWLKPIIDLQLKGMNPAIETTSWKAGKLLSASFTKFEYATTPATEIYPGKIQAIKITTPSVSFTPAIRSTTTVAKDTRYADETTLKFYNGNLAELTPRSGVTSSYIWGYNNNLPVVKAEGVSQATLKAAYDAVSGNLVTLRLQPSLSTAMLNTYVYTPLVGMISETNVANRASYYEYDKLQRLVMVRDHDNNILKRICYTYSGKVVACGIFTSEVAFNVFTKQCTGGYIGSQVTYTVPSGTYTSNISQLDANTQATNDVAANGQAYANANRICSPPPVNVQGYNAKTTTYSVRFTSNETSLQYVFNLTPNTYSFNLLGQVPSGIYTVAFYPAGSPVTATFVVNGLTFNGTNATFNNVSVTGLTNAYMY